MGRGLCLIEKDQINCPKFGHVEIKIVSDSDSDKTVKVWLYVYIISKEALWYNTGCPYVKKRIFEERLRILFIYFFINHGM